LVPVEGTSKFGTTGSIHKTGSKQGTNDAIGRWLNQSLQEDPFNVFKVFSAGEKAEVAADGKRT